MTIVEDTNRAIVLPKYKNIFIDVRLTNSGDLDDEDIEQIKQDKEIIIARHNFESSNYTYNPGGKRKLIILSLNIRNGKIVDSMNSILEKIFHAM